MQLIAGYVVVLFVFVLVDGVWLSVMGKLLYRPILGDILLTNLRIAPAIVFYAVFPVGIVTFAVVPALKSGSIGNAAGFGLLFGALAYGTYDLTNYATLRNWNLQLTALDIGYGALATAAAATVATLALRFVSSWI
jgi:uncharacterized membrane protein